MEGYTKSVPSAKVPPGEMMSVEVGDDLVLIANVDGKYYGIGALCNHEQWDLSEGTLADTTVTCAGHGTVWDLKTGVGEFDEPLEREPLYDVVEKDGDLYVKRR